MGMYMFTLVHFFTSCQLWKYFSESYNVSLQEKQFYLKFIYEVPVCRLSSQSGQRKAEQCAVLHRHGVGESRFQFYVYVCKLGQISQSSRHVCLLCQLKQMKRLLGVLSCLIALLQPQSPMETHTTAPLQSIPNLHWQNFLCYNRLVVLMIEFCVNGSMQYLLICVFFFAKQKRFEIYLVCCVYQ